MKSDQLTPLVSHWFISMLIYVWDYSQQFLLCSVIFSQIVYVV